MKATRAAIYASKVFQCSKRQKEIRQKIESAENIELLQQLIGDLDEEFQTVNTVAPELNDASKDKQEKESEPDEKVKDEKPAKSPSVGQPISFTPSSEEDEPEENTEGVAPDEASDEASSDKSKETVAESTHINVIPLDEIKGTLNHVSDTAGVSRIEVKDHELWVFYNDEVNLNNIMTEVIELLNNTGYTYLSFNRLARSNNAIVFEVSYNTTMVGDVIE